MEKEEKKQEEIKNAFQEVNESVQNPNLDKIVRDKDVQQANDEINLDENTADRG